jgi:hypothetical protein
MVAPFAGEVTVTPANASDADRTSKHTISDRGDFNMKRSKLFIGFRLAELQAKLPSRASGRDLGTEEVATVAFTRAPSQASERGSSLFESNQSNNGERLPETLYSAKDKIMGFNSKVPFFPFQNENLSNLKDPTCY